MRQALPAIVVAALLAATIVDVVSAGVRTATRGGRVYSITPAGISVAVPATMKNFPTELLPQ